MKKINSYKTNSSKMPIKAALKIGCANYKYHPIRFVVTILLAVFSFTFFGLSISYGIMDKVNPFVNAVYKNNLEYVTLQYFEAVENDDESQLTFEEFISGLTDLNNIDVLFTWRLNNPIKKLNVSIYTKQAIDKLQAHYSEQLELVENYTHILHFTPIRERTDFSERKEQELNIWTNPVFYGAMTLHEEVIEKYDFELIGNLPQKKDEIVVSESYYNYLMMYGLHGEDGKEYEFTSPQDLVEKKIVLDDMLITGVMLTGCDYNCKYNHGHYAIDNYNGKNYFYLNLQLEDEYLYHCKMFVTADYIFESSANNDSDTNDIYLLCPVSKDKKQFKQFTRYLVENNKEYQNVKGTYFDFSAQKNDSINSEFIDYRESVININRSFSIMMLYIGIIFLIFTFVFLLNFITTSIQGQIKQIGIVSAMGANFKKLFFVYLLSSLILCGAVYLLTLLSTRIVIAYLNGSGYALLWFAEVDKKHIFDVLSLNIWVISILLIISITVALLGTLISMRKLRKLTPAEIFRKGQVK